MVQQYTFHRESDVWTAEETKTKKSLSVPLLSSIISEEWRQTARQMGLNLERKTTPTQRTTYGNSWLLIFGVTCNPPIRGSNVSHLRDVKPHTWEICDLAALSYLCVQNSRGIFSHCTDMRLLISQEEVGRRRVIYLHRIANDRVLTMECCSSRSAILEEVQNQGNTKLPSNKNVLVLGDNETGKTTLIAKLQGVEDPKKGSALEYAYIDVRDEYRDGKFVCLSVTHFLWCIIN